MRPSKFTDAEIMQALDKVTSGTPATQICRALGITETTFYRWRNKYDATRTLDPAAVRRLQQENGRLKQLVAELLLERQEGSGGKDRSRPRRPIAR